MISMKYVKTRQVCKVKFDLPEGQLPEGLVVETVALAGSFNNWDKQETPMKYSAAKNGYWVEIDLEPGQEYQFRYVINGDVWHNDADAPSYKQGGWDWDNCCLTTLAE